MIKRVIALGFFDGVHLGHGELLKAAVSTAAQLDCRSMAISFDVHPDSLTGRANPGLINTKADRAGLMARLYGIEDVRFLHFDRAMMEMPWAVFLENVCCRELLGTHLICGEDFRFGHRGQGNASLLREWCARRGLGCDIIPPLSQGGAVISSTRIRSLLGEGKMEEAARLLGHRHICSGIVVPGRGIGTTKLLPTANLPVAAQLVPLPRGVYAVYALLGCSEERLPGVANCGVNPTAGALDAPNYETHIFGLSRRLYGERLTVEFVSFLRPEQRFPDFDALREQVERDCARARELLTPAPSTK